MRAKIMEVITKNKYVHREKCTNYNIYTSLCKKIKLYSFHTRVIQSAHSNIQTQNIQK